MEKYHIRHPEKELNQKKINKIISEKKYMTISICKANQPYLFTVNYAFNSEQNCFYFHSALEGKKIDYLNANQNIWGQIIDDRGYLQTECNHAYQTVQFEGQVEFVKEIGEKRLALSLMMDQLEDNPEPLKKKMIKDNALKNVAICKVNVIEISGKKNGF